MSLFVPELADSLVSAAATSVGVVTGLYAVVSWLDEDGEQRIGVASMSGQSVVVTQGLLTFAGAAADSALTQYLMTDSSEADGDGG